MSISVEKAGNFKNIRYTAKGNQYRKTNTGKTIGAVCMATIPVVDILKNANEIKTGFPNALKEFGRNAKEMGFEVDAKQASVILKSGMAISGIANVATSALAGLVVGAAVDFVVNKIKAHKADKENAKIIA